MTVTEIVQIGSLVLLSVTFLLSFLTYRRNKKMELQNHLYKIKLEAFANIIYEIEQFSNKADKMIVILKKISGHNQIGLTPEVLDKMADDIDEEMYKCSANILKNSVYFSTTSTELLSTFAGNIFGNLNVNPDSKEENDLEMFDKYYTNQLDLANEAVEKLRNELGLESLNKSLFGRVN